MFTKREGHDRDYQNGNIAERHCFEVLRTFKYLENNKRTKDYRDWTKMAEYHPIRAKCSVV